MANLSPILVPTLEELAGEFDRAHAAERAISIDDEEEYDGALAQLTTICQEIAALPAQSPEHLRLKARAFMWHEHPQGREPATTGERLAYQLASGVLQGLLE